MRHAKSGYPDGVDDFDRPLSERGRREGPLAGEWIRGQVGEVDAVLCSGAARTRETLQVAGIDAPTTYADEIYEATAGEILAQIAQTAGDVRRLLVVGHAPGIPSTVAALATDDSDAEALRAVRAKFPTSAIAVLEFDGGWPDLAAVGARLTYFEVPR
ncbi:phosphohistidine phosphatase [Antricoccus suffuscus]|uniref:Phosphohistidine phosphatase n=2 Tax=Antricoccus suffuscus TaxID=1629062 RepID=A0A2T1A5Q7_9ACTN|nr:phosphohistidine phosphatase [Antricoccus suffuscus]